METCKWIKKHTTTGWGITGKSQCSTPVFKDGYCEHHYRRWQAKMINWGDRPNYDAATMDDLIKQRSLKLKNSFSHRLFRFNKGIIQENKQDEYFDTDLPVDNTLFCVKNRI